MNTQPDRQIVVKKRGNRLGFWFFRVSLRVFGLRGAYGLLYIVCSYYLLFDRKAVRSALAYIRRRFRNRARVWQYFAAYRLFVAQGKSLIDRYYLLSGVGTFDTAFLGYEGIKPLLENPHQGIVVIMSHVGNWQLILATIGNLNRKVRLVMRPEDNAAVRESLDIDKETGMVQIISPESFMGGAIEIAQALRQGHIVCMMGDRHYGFSAEPVTFLGDSALLPGGPFAVAAATGSPVVVLFSAKVSAIRYEIEVAHIFHPAYAPGIPRREQLREWLQQLAALLENYVQRHPFQCFLFHDIWESGTGVTPPDRLAEVQNPGATRGQE